jgi:HK97 gp10 family phage protein
VEITFKALGLEEWVRKINALKNIENDQKVNKALGRGAERVRSAVVLLTPVGLPEYGGTGNLRNKIFTDNPKANEWHVTTNVEYAIFVEYGTGKLGDPTVPHTSKESWVYYNDFTKTFFTTHGQKPAHMFTKGFATTHKAVTEIVKKEIEEIVRNA